MSRYVSFGVLIAVILILGIVFYQVMAAFVLPIFLATVLVVVFGPVHQWVLDKTEYRKTLAAALTTGIIGLAVILPVGGVGIVAFGEARHLFKNLTSGGIEQNLKRVRKSLSLEMPAPEEFRALDKTVRALDVRNVDELDLAEKQLDRIDENADRFETAVKIPKLNSTVEESLDNSLIGVPEIELWRTFRDSVRSARESQVQLFRLEAIAKNGDPIVDSRGIDNKEKKDSTKANDQAEDVASIKDEIQLTEKEFRASMEKLLQDFDRFRLQTLGGGIYAYFKEVANPSPEEFEKYNETLINWISENFLSLGGQATQFVIGIIVDSMIMMIAVFFFLLDGPKMIAALKFFSPLDDRHEQELIEEFAKVCRAVLVATLTAAAVQAMLAGVGYYFAGVEAVFLLTLTTGVFAMVPFVGAAAVWAPTCVYLYLVDDRLVAGILLAIWGAGVVSTIDNVIKPYILHGQSNIHPLLALLSVLGGVSALGPIGILVGPMVVVFLQTTLTVLQSEIREMDNSNGNPNPEDSDDESISQESTIIQDVNLDELDPDAESGSGEKGEKE